MLRVLEISWLVILILGVVFGVYRWWADGIDSALTLFIFTFISAVFYVIRRKQRIAMEREDQD